MDTNGENYKNATVQHVTKKSSDELLRKFADEEEEESKKESLRLSKRRKRSNKKTIIKRDEVNENYNYSWCETPSRCLVERSVLPKISRKNLMLRQLGIGRTQLRARDFKNKSFLVAIEKTWRKTLEGASKVLLEKHYNRHKRLISDVV